MFASDAGRAASRALQRAGWLLHAHVVEAKLQALRDAIEDKYDPNQPRVPAGNPDGGQWTDGGGGTGGRLPSGPGTLLDVGEGESERVRLAQNDPPDLLSDVGRRPRKLPRAIRSVSDIPKERPSSIQVVNAVGKFVAYELADYITRQGERPLVAGVRGKLLRRFFVGFEIALWVRDDDAASLGARPGYEIHHVVERNSASDEDDDRIDAPENLVSIPVFKHHLITGWSMRKNDRFGDIPPRRYLKGKSWEERNEIGMGVLVRYGVLRR